MVAEAIAALKERTVPWRPQYEFRVFYTGQHKVTETDWNAIGIIGVEGGEAKPKNVPRKNATPKKRKTPSTSKKPAAMQGRNRRNPEKRKTDSKAAAAPGTKSAELKPSTKAKPKKPKPAAEAKLSKPKTVAKPRAKASTAAEKQK
ncbi:hypothetical protein WJX72_007589 [[Myrmecia] bisecta]|uniref:Histone H1 n=1 Tax=[Myrmecia] bisecta TaxID=41462 RepID=A0AAW1P7P0_9CHLO